MNTTKKDFFIKKQCEHNNLILYIYIYIFTYELQCTAKSDCGVKKYGFWLHQCSHILVFGGTKNNNITF